jgi:NAD(P)-dependent dehydrogenase (short-subunit alcohol dehydrogenase family)
MRWPQFGGIDIYINNAAAIDLVTVEEVPLKRFDLLNGIQIRGTYAVSQACIPHMTGRDNPHIQTLSPPVRLESEWLRPTAYMMAKFGMTLCALGIAEEMRDAGIASNTLWPRTLVATAAVQNLLGGDEAMARARKPQVYSDAARRSHTARPFVHRPQPSARTCFSNPVSPTSRPTTARPIQNSNSTSGWTARTHPATRTTR